MYDKKHVDTVQRFAGMIMDDFRNQAKHHDEDKKMHDKHDDSNLPRHHWLVTNNEVNLIDVAEAIADNLAGADEYGDDIRFPIAEKHDGLKQLISNTILKYRPSAKITWVRTR